jgi:hypothetical protein
MSPFQGLKCSFGALPPVSPKAVFMSSGIFFKEKELLLSTPGVILISPLRG